jgi:hypothetical protein
MMIFLSVALVDGLADDAPPAPPATLPLMPWSLTGSYLFGANIRLYDSEDSALIPAHERLYPDNNPAKIGAPFKKTVKGTWAPLLWYSPVYPTRSSWAGYGENSDEMHAIVARLDCRLTRRAVTGYRFPSRVS